MESFQYWALVKSRLRPIKASFGHGWPRLAHLGPDMKRSKRSRTKMLCWRPQVGSRCSFLCFPWGQRKEGKSVIAMMAKLSAAAYLVGDNDGLRDLDEEREVLLRHHKEFLSGLRELPSATADEYDTKFPADVDALARTHKTLSLLPSPSVSRQLNRSMSDRFDR